VRIDRFLHCIRLAKSRTLAQALVETGHIRIDGKRVEKPSDPVPAEARACYEELGVDGESGGT
jgi:ribosome-associated heat shock protein Hsp15